MLRLRYSLLAITLLIVTPSIAFADAKSFDAAVNEYLKGFRACSDANTLRSTNIIEANKKFMYYKQQLDLAVATDETILTSTERDMNRNLEYCQRVEDNLKRAEATPILQHAFTYCEAACGSYEKAQYNQTRQEFEDYLRYKEDAYAITQTIDEVFVLASQVRSCGRFEEKLAKKEQEANKQKESLQEVVALYQKFKQECDSTLAFVSKPNFRIKELTTANKMLNAAGKSKKAANSKEGAFKFASANPQAGEAIQLVELQESARICEGAVKERIRNTTKQKRALQSFITVKNGNLKESLNQCQIAEEEANASNLKGSTKAYQTSSSLKKKATGTKTVKLIKTYPQWKASKTYNQLLKQTKTCQEQASTSIKKLQDVIALAKEAAQKRAEQAAEDNAQEKEEAKTTEPTEATPPKPEETAAEEPSKAEEPNETAIEKPVEQSVTETAKPDNDEAKPTAAPNDPENWEDAELEEEPENDELLEDDASSSRKSWTDLVK